MAQCDGPPRKVRFITYMSPTLPIEFFEAIQHYLEEKLGFESVLMYESRWEGPPEHKADPFTQDEVDFAFMNGTTFLRLLTEKNEYVELLPVAAVHPHPKNPGLEPIYFSDVIIHKDNSAKYEDFHRLKGCKWAYTGDKSLSGYMTTLKYLKLQGTNANFFGHIIKSGSHINSINMVASHTVDAAAISSNCLSSYLERNPIFKSKIHVLTSWGPLPSSPIVVNKRLPDSFKTNVKDALLDMERNPVWKEKLAEVCVEKFVPVDLSLYNHEVELAQETKSLSIDTVYY